MVFRILQDVNENFPILEKLGDMRLRFKIPKKCTYVDTTYLTQIRLWSTGHDL